MHEQMIAGNIVAAVREQADPAALNSISEIGVRIGALSDVDPDSLRFAFAAAVSGTPLDGALLVIEAVAARMKCTECQKTSLIRRMTLECPECGNTNVELLSGVEMALSWIRLSEGENFLTLVMDEAEETGEGLI